MSILLRSHLHFIYVSVKADVSTLAVILVLSTLSALVCFLSLILPKNIKLPQPQTMEDAENVGT